jgi:predicted metal-binding membrane protein
MMTNTGTALESLLKCENAVVLVSLLVLTLLAWLILLAGAGSGMDPAAMSGWWLPPTLPAGESWSWTPSYWLITFLMWVVMMVAMMLPSAAPLLLLYAMVLRHAESRGRPSRQPAAITAFASGYLALWTFFSALAVVIQFGLEKSGLMSVMMSSRSTALSGALLIAAGLYQLSPLKAACLKHCRGPAAFLSAHWRPGVAGAWRMGLLHGVYCLGCCAVLMLLLFVGGMMNLVWIAGLTLFVAFEKFAPFGEVMGKAVAVLLVAGGGVLIAIG